MKKSLYTRAVSRHTRLKNTGFNYEGKIFEKTMSPILFLDPVRKSILQEYEKLIFFLVEKSKTVKTFFNYTVDKDYRELN